MKDSIDYWKVGDEVYCFEYGKGYIYDIDKSLYPIGIKFNRNKVWYISDTTAVYHIEAITFDNNDKPVAINQDYIPPRCKKFKAKDIVLCNDSTESDTWYLCEYITYDPELKKHAVKKQTNKISYFKHCRPYTNF